MTSTTPTPDDQPLDDAAPPAVPLDEAALPGDAVPADGATQPDADTGGEPWASPAVAAPSGPADSENEVVPQVAGSGPGDGPRARFARHPIATGAVAATLAAGLAFGGGVLVGQATASPATSGWADRSRLPGAPPDRASAGGRGGFGPVAPVARTPDRHRPSVSHAGSPVLLLGDSA